MNSLETERVGAGCIPEAGGDDRRQDLRPTPSAWSEGASRTPTRALPTRTGRRTARRQAHNDEDAAGGVVFALDAARPAPGVVHSALTPRCVAKATHWAVMSLGAAEVLASQARADGAAVPVQGCRVQGLGLMVFGLWFLVYGLCLMVYCLLFMVYGFWVEA